MFKIWRLKKSVENLPIKLNRHFAHYEQGQEPEPKIREYFYYIDHEGMV